MTKIVVLVVFTLFLHCLSQQCPSGQLWNGEECISCFQNRFWVERTNRCQCISSPILLNKTSCVICRNEKETRRCNCPNTHIYVNGFCVMKKLPEMPCTGGRQKKIQTNSCQCPNGQSWDGQRCSFSRQDSRLLQLSVREIIEKAESCQRSNDCSQEEKYPKLTASKELRQYFLDRYRNIPPPQLSYVDQLQNVEKFRKQIYQNYSSPMFHQFYIQDLRIPKIMNANNFDIIKILIQRGRQRKDIIVSGVQSSPQINSIIPTITNRFLYSESNTYKNVNHGNIQVNEGSALFKIKRQSNNVWKLVAYNLNGPNMQYCWNMFFTNGVLRQLHVKNGFLIIIFEDLAGPFPIVYVAQTQLVKNLGVTTCWVFPGLSRSFRKRGHYVGSRQLNNNLIVVTQIPLIVNNHLIFQVYEGGVWKDVNPTQIYTGAYPQFNKGFARHIWCIKIDYPSGQYRFAQYHSMGYTNTINFKQANLYVAASQFQNFKHQILVVQAISPTSSTPWLAKIGGQNLGVIEHDYEIDELKNRLRVFSKTFFNSPETYFLQYPLPIGTPNIYPKIDFESTQHILFFQRYAFILLQKKIMVYDMIAPSLSKKYLGNRGFFYSLKYGKGDQIVVIGRNSKWQMIFVMIKLSGGEIKQIHSETPWTDFSIGQDPLVFSQDLKWEYQAILFQQETNSIIFGIKNLKGNDPHRQGMYYLYADTSGCFQPVTPALTCSQPKFPPIFPQLYPHKNKSWIPTEAPHRYTIVLNPGNGKFFLYSSSNDYIQARQIDPFYPSLIYSLPQNSGVEYAI